MSPEQTDFLYPFIDASERDLDKLLADLARSAAAKARESAELQAAMLARWKEELDRTAAEIVLRFAKGGRLYTFGNGGSATDAASMAALFAQPATGVGLPARCLVEDEAVVTALGNDVGFDLAFSRQVIAFGRAEDIAMGYSTSGSSQNLIVAFEEAKARDLLTIGFAGYEGGRMATCDALDHCLVVSSDSVHRIQEAQAALSYALWSGVRDRLPGEEGR